MALEDQRIVIRYDDAKHRYWINGQPVPGVSDIIGSTTAKEGLAWWGMRVGIAGVVRMMNEVAWAEIANANTPEEIIRPAILGASRGYQPKGGRKGKYVSLIEKWIREAKLTTNDVLEDAGLKGDEVHFCLEQLGVGDMPDVGEIRPERRGYVAGLCQWFIDQEPEFEEQERIIGSAAHMFAGRYDMVIRTPLQRRVLKDLKSSGNIYLSYAEQLSAYRIGRTEMRGGDDDLDGQGVVWVGENGDYLDIEMVHVPQAFLAARELYRQREASFEAHRGRRGIYEIDNERRW